MIYAVIDTNVLVAAAKSHKPDSSASRVLSLVFSGGKRDVRRQALPVGNTAIATNVVPQPPFPAPPVKPITW